MAMLIKQRNFEMCNFKFGLFYSHGKKDILFTARMSIISNYHDRKTRIRFYCLLDRKEKIAIVFQIYSLFVGICFEEQMFYLFHFLRNHVGRVNEEFFFLVQYFFSSLNCYIFSPS